jgi:hypothetical protein
MMNHFFQLAYLDPGTGSMLLQAIVGGSAGMIVFFRHLWRSYRLNRRATDSVQAVPES